MNLVPDAVSLWRFRMSKDKLITLSNRGAPFEHSLWRCFRLNEGNATFHPLSKPVPATKVAMCYWTAHCFFCCSDARHEFFDSSRRPRLIDTSAFHDHNYVYVTPAEVGR